jgi:hypothetical protein
LDFVEITLLAPGSVDVEHTRSLLVRYGLGCTRSLGLLLESFASKNEALIGATALWRDVVGNPSAFVRDGLAFLRAKASEHGLFG